MVRWVYRPIPWPPGRVRHQSWLGRPQDVRVRLAAERDTCVRRALHSEQTVSDPPPAHVSNPRIDSQAQVACTRLPSFTQLCFR